MSCADDSNIYWRYFRPLCKLNLSMLKHHFYRYLILSARWKLTVRARVDYFTKAVLYYEEIPKASFFYLKKAKNFFVL
jgi:hypothetical protein